MRRSFTTLAALGAMAVFAACTSEMPTAVNADIAAGPRLAVTSTSKAVFDNIPALVPPNVPSWGYQATQTSEFGDLIQLAGTDRHALSATVIMSDWAKRSDYPGADAAGFKHPITLTIYAVNAGNANLPGALLGTVTQTFTIPWRPEADPTCAVVTKWRAADGNCYNGFATPITFDLKGLNLTLPDKFIYGIAYNTNTWGYHPLNAPGPYESLNVGLNEVGPTVGTDVDTDALFLNSATAGWYSDGGAGGVNIFRRDTNWSPYSPMVQFTANTVATTANGCKNGGWQSLGRADGSTFKNQGDCLQYVNTGK